MKNLIIYLVASLVGLIEAKETPKNPEVSRTKQEAPASEKPVANSTPARIRFKGKAGAPTTCTLAATRSGNQGSIRLVALAPGNEGVTHKARPRLWWYQSADTDARELEFILSRMDGPKPRIIMRTPMPVMEEGFNVIDFAHKGFNRSLVSLESGGIYQWTIRLVSEESAPQVYCRMKVVITDTPDVDQGLQELAESGNWYELFDAISTASEKESSEVAIMLKQREGLLRQIGLEDAIK